MQAWTVLSNLIFMFYFFGSYSDFRKCGFSFRHAFYSLGNTEWNLNLWESQFPKLSLIGDKIISLVLNLHSELPGANPEIYIQRLAFSWLFQCTARVGKLLDKSISQVSPSSISLKFSIWVDTMTQFTIVT